MTEPLHTGIVYGPVRSRRLGRSLGINILPPGPKYCNFNCPYCQYGWTPAGACSAASPEWPGVGAILDAVAASLQSDPHVDHITLAGNGEPTLHPEFGAVVEGLRNVRRRCAPVARLAVLSNSSTLDSPSVLAALHGLDDRFMKLDAGDDATLRRMNASPRPLDAIVRGLSRLESVVIQSMFARDPGRVDNVASGAVDAWLAALERIRPQGVHIYTLDRSPALPRLQRISHEELQAIARRVEGLGIPVQVF